MGWGDGIRPCIEARVGGALERLHDQQKHRALVGYTRGVVWEREARGHKGRKDQEEDVSNPDGMGCPWRRRPDADDDPVEVAVDGGGRTVLVAVGWEVNRDICCSPRAPQRRDMTCSIHPNPDHGRQSAVDDVFWYNHPQSDYFWRNSSRMA